jgi:inosose dehydratase
MRDTSLGAGRVSARCHGGSRSLGDCLDYERIQPQRITTTLRAGGHLLIENKASTVGQHHRGAASNLLPGRPACMRGTACARSTPPDAVQRSGWPLTPPLRSRPNQGGGRYGLIRFTVPDIMRGLKIGIGPSAYGIRASYSDTQIQWDSFLDLAQSADFDGVELGTWGYLPQDGRRLWNELRTRGLDLAAGALIADFAFGGGWQETNQRMRVLCDLLAQCGATRLVLIDASAQPSSTVPHGGELNRPAWLRTIDRIGEVASYANKQGLVAAFHPHAGTIIETPEEVEQFLVDSDPRVVGLCLDTAHYGYFKGDAAALIKRHGTRIAHLHIKNVNPTVLAEVRNRHLSFEQAVAMGVMTDLESGMIDFGVVLEALAEADYHGWAVVEHDISPASLVSPHEVAVKNRKFLTRLGIVGSGREPLVS